MPNISRKSTDSNVQSAEKLLKVTLKILNSLEALTTEVSVNLTTLEDTLNSGASKPSISFNLSLDT